MENSFTRDLQGKKAIKADTSLGGKRLTHSETVFRNGKADDTVMSP